MNRDELRGHATLATITTDAGTVSGRKVLRCVLTYEEAVAFIDGGQGDWAFGDSSSGWHGESKSDFKEHAFHGMPPMKDIDDFVREVEELLDLDTLGPSWEQDLMGGSPNIPAYLTGSPLSMNRWVEQEENRNGLVRIICDASSSCNIHSKMLAARAKAVTALVRTISMFRPVEFWLASCGAPGYQDKGVMNEVYDYAGTSDVDTCCMVQISSTPVDMGMVTLAMSQAFCRRFMYGVEYNLVENENSGSLGWPSNNVKYCVSLNEDERYAPAFDIIIPPLHSNENENFSKDAAKWVREQTIQALEGTGAAHTVYENNHI